MKVSSVGEITTYGILTMGNAHSFNIIDYVSYSIASGSTSNTAILAPTLASSLNVPRILDLKEKKQQTTRKDKDKEKENTLGIRSPPEPLDNDTKGKKRKTRTRARRRGRNEIGFGLGMMLNKVVMGLVGGKLGST
ncbi:hypothetical protein JCM11641_007428 [Rhodosporidiobolus odoratus]